MFGLMCKCVKEFIQKSNYVTLENRDGREKYSLFVGNCIGNFPRKKVISFLIREM